jgi:hypothetical protein
MATKQADAGRTAELEQLVREQIAQNREWAFVINGLRAEIATMRERLEDALWALEISRF